MTRSNVMAISERSTLSTERTPRVSDACFNDWKRFCFVLREIASGEKGSPLSGVKAQKRAQAILRECGYAWPSSDRMCEPIVAFSGGRFRHGTTITSSEERLRRERNERKAY
jgi:hypothetical protein